MRLMHIAGARPNFMKVAPVIEALRQYPQAKQLLVHTGQHYDDALSAVFFDELGIPRPDVNLAVGSGTHAEQTARIMMAFEPVCREWQPDLVFVYGDINSTVACALVAAKLQCPVAHVEAGLRSFDWSMPEEINRIVTDRLSHLLFTSERSGNVNLLNEGVPPEKIHYVGNVMIDTLMRQREHALKLNAPAKYGVKPKNYVLATLHRPGNVDAPESLQCLVTVLGNIAQDTPVLFPVHPRTRQRLVQFGLTDLLGKVRVLEPLGYLEFMGLMADAGCVLTDSGGVQEETTVLGVPCLTARPNTERPATIEEGTNRLVRLHVAELEHQIRECLEAPPSSQARIPELWDGRAAERIARIVMNGSNWANNRTSLKATA